MNDGKDVDAGVVFVAENLDNFPFRTHPAFRIACQADDDFVPLDGAVFGVLRNKDVIRDFFIVGNDEAEVFRLCICADNLLNAALNDADDGPFFFVPPDSVLRRTSTVSPFIAVFSSDGGMKTSSSEESSGRTNAKPFACADTFPLIKFIFSGKP